ncbi:uncharacterized protein LOC124925668 [Impatiens glandulifera]|uniref:uncharacterized protein LOC124925668 n=1 Tax=Impatiens glandulifera TaxID=253017 RepID=UPI001FB0A2DD|nr:uncharacterized protein LOC124925668 [Impatiens glandulifera]
MQKLLRSRTPSGPILATYPIPFLSSPSSSTATITNGTKLSFLTPPSQPRMPALRLSLSKGASSISIVGSSKKTITNRISSWNSCRMCHRSINSTDTARAWVVLKGTRVSPRLAWFQTVASKKTDEIDEIREEDVEDADKGSDERLLKMHRRQKVSSSGNMLPGNPDLLTIPGVGPRNLRKLVDNGIAGVAELKKLYKDKFFGKGQEKMVEFLQSSVGIIHKNHAESITIFIKQSVDEEESKTDNSDSCVQRKKRLTFCVEGNISVGKTTFLQRIANETLELRDLVEIVPEPINKWQDVGPDHFNVLDAFYAEPQRYAYTFQNYVFVTRVMQERESSSGIKPLRLMERSVFSDRMVFVRAVHEANWMNEMEISIYDSWFDPVVSFLPGLIPDAFIYLRASPDTCHKRMSLRMRAEEGGVSLDYLRDLHEKHESWLFPWESGNHGLLNVNKLPNMDFSSHPNLKDRVIFLEGTHMHPSIQQVPALVLDCEPNIDFSKDVEAKREYARQVAEFFEFVKRRNEDKEEDAEGKKKSSGGEQAQVMLPPQKGRLWMPPDAKHFPESALNSLEFRRAMTYLSG